MTPTSRQVVISIIGLAFSLAMIEAGASAAGADELPGPKSPAASLADILVPDGFVVELVAAEPLVRDPVAIAWGLDGRLWVVEMGDYNHLPIDKSGGDADVPHGRVRCLQDTNGDGRYYKATTFIDGLNYPNGVLPWRDGLLITSAPDVIYAEDTDGDGRADVRRVLFTGFNPGNPQLRINGLRWGLDGWVYCANGLSNGKVKAVQTVAGGPVDASSTQPIDIRGHDVRLRPDTGEIEAIAGVSQFGRNRDDWGNWFGCDNSRLLFHFFLPQRYARRNPDAASPQSRLMLVSPKNPPVHPAGPGMQRFHAPYMHHRFTSACSANIYRDVLIDADIHRNAFVCEPVHNCIRRLVLTRDGASFQAQPILDGSGDGTREFLASHDAWFRPVMIRTGPDGALWIADMYRLAIEHAQWIPDAWKEKIELRAGHDRGRIYRVYRKGAPPRDWLRGLEELNKDPRLLAEKMDSPNGTLRDMLQMAMVWRGANAGDGEALLKIQNASPHAAARLQAAATRMMLLDASPVALLDDEHSEVRRQGVQWVGEFAAGDLRAKQRTALLARLADMADDAAPAVRFQLALTLGEFDHQLAGEALGRLLLRDGRDPLMRAAVLSSARHHAGAMLAALMQAGERSEDVAGEAAGPLVRTLFSGSDESSRQAWLKRLAAIEPEAVRAWHFDALAGALDAMGRKRGEAQAWLGSDAAGSLARLFVTAGRWAADADRMPAQRISAIGVLGRSGDEKLNAEHAAVLTGLLDPATPAGVQSAVVEQWARLGGPTAPGVFFGRWSSLGPQTRSAIIETLLRRDAWAGALLDALESGAIQRADLSAATRQRLVEHRSADLQQRAKRLFASTQTSRADVVQAHKDVLTMPGEAERGRMVFEKNCAVCHRLGSAVQTEHAQPAGPDLGALTDRSPGFVLTSILDPNSAVDPRYVSYLVRTIDGDSHVGMIVGETANAVTLAAVNGQRQTILRRDIETLRSTGMSLMPEGLEKTLDKQSLADVIAFVAARSAPRRDVPGVKAGVVRPALDGSLYLQARQCEIFGRRLTYEAANNNLAQWTLADDYAAWTVDVPNSGEYEIWLDWSCNDESAGNSFTLRAGGESLTATVPATGSWSRYRQQPVGHIQLNAGKQRVMLRARPPLQGQLMHLRSIRLAPK